MRAIIVTHPTPNNIKDLIHLIEDDYVIGVDQAIKALIDQNIDIDLAVGDFDSLEDLDVLRDLDVIKLNPIKDITDSYQALYEAEKRGYESLIMVGGFGGDRIEHFIAHLLHFNRFESLEMINEHSRITMKKEGEYTFSSQCYISFFPYPEAIITLQGFKYPLDLYVLKLFDPLCISNELVLETGTLTVHQGTVLVIESNKK